MGRMSQLTTVSKTVKQVQSLRFRSSLLHRIDDVACQASLEESLAFNFIIAHIKSVPRKMGVNKMSQVSLMFEKKKNHENFYKQPCSADCNY